MKVALFLYHFPVRSETFVVQQALALVRSGAELTIITQNYYSDEWSNFLPEVAETLRHRIVVLPHTEWHELPFSLIKTMASPACWRFLSNLPLGLRAGLRGMVRSFPAWVRMPSLGTFDVVLAHFGPIGVQAMVLRELGAFAAPIATVFHGFDMSRRSVLARYRAGYSMLFDKAELMLPISDLWRRRLIEWGAAPGKLKVQRMGVDLPNEPPNFNIPTHDPLRIISVGRITEKKAHRDVVEAIAKCESAVELDIIGSGELEHELRELARSMPTASVNLLGAKPHRETLAAIGSADVFVLPSVTASDGDMEGIPVVIMEAMAAGTVVVVTRHSGTPELVEHGVTGFLVDEHDPDGIAEVIDRISAGDFDLATIRRSAFEKIRAEFHTKDLDHRLVKILTGISSSSVQG